MKLLLVAVLVLVLLAALAAPAPAADAESPTDANKVVAESPTDVKEVVAESPTAVKEVVAESPTDVKEVVAESLTDVKEVVAESPTAVKEVVAESPTDVKDALLALVAADPKTSAEVKAALAAQVSEAVEHLAYANKQVGGVPAVTAAVTESPAEANSRAALADEDQVMESPTNTSSTSRLPAYFPKACARNAAGFNECVRKNMQEVIPHLADGEKLFNMAPMDPLAVDDFRFDLAYFTIDFKSVTDNIKLRGFSAMIVQAVRAKVTDNKLDMECDVLIPKLTAEGKYTLDGRFGIFPYAGRGPWNFTMNNVHLKLHLLGGGEARNGVNFMHLKRMTPDYTVEGFRMHTGNEIAEYEGVTTLATNIFNQFWRSLIPFAVRVSRGDVERVIKKVGKSVFNSVPLEQLFPENM